MKCVKTGDGQNDKVLIVRYQKKLYAVGNFCSHFGVPLEGGQLFDDKVLCPAHAAGFSVITGESETGPGRDGLPTFPIVQRDGQNYVQVPKEDKLPGNVVMPMAKRDPDNKQHFVIIGGGPAGLNAAETLRQSGFTGQITVLTREDSLPYDRTLISKALPAGDPAKWLLRPADWLAEHDIDYRFKSKGNVFSVNTEKKKVITVGGDHIQYDKLLIATGANLFFPPIQGLGKMQRDAPKKVHFLRTADDMNKCKAAVADAKRVVMVGAGFIGSEAAAALIGKYKDMDLHMICPTDVPF